MTDHNQDEHKKETPAPEAQKPVELSDEQVEGVAGGIGLEPVYSQAGASISSGINPLVNTATIQELKVQMLAGK